MADVDRAKEMSDIDKFAEEQVKINMALIGVIKIISINIEKLEAEIESLKTKLQ